MELQLLLDGVGSLLSRLQRRNEIEQRYREKRYCMRNGRVRNGRDEHFYWRHSSLVREPRHTRKRN